MVLFENSESANKRDEEKDDDDDVEEEDEEKEFVYVMLKSTFTYSSTIATAPRITIAKVTKVTPMYSYLYNFLFRYNTVKNAT